MNDSHAYIQRSPEKRAARLAVLHDRGNGHPLLVSILAGAGLPPNAGVLPLNRADELVGDPPEAIIFSADLGRAERMAALRDVRWRFEDARVVAVARHARDGQARQALNAGAHAFVIEKDAAGVLVPAVRAVVAGLVCIPRLHRRVVAKPTFSHRERQVLELLMGGMTNSQIADQLCVAESTVKSHVASSFSKLGVHSRVHAAAILSDPAEGFAITAARIAGR